MNECTLRLIDEVAMQGIADGQMAGCVVTIGHRGQLALLRAYGHRQIEPTPVSMTVDTVFDLASLTKPIVTATSVMLLWEDGKFQLCDPVARYLPEFGSRGKEHITIEDLLTHQGGLIPDNALSDYREGPKAAWQSICELPVRAPRAERFIYSDVGFIVLGKLVERVSGQSLQEFVRTRLFAPLGMSNTGFLPSKELQARAAATEQRNGAWLRGQVHDPRAHLLGGVAGHAGLFSTAEDLAIYAQMILRSGQLDDVRVLHQDTVAMMTRSHRTSAGFRTLGWDSRSSYSSNRGSGFSASAFGHGGFTGTSLWIDPANDLFVIFLSNRLHPDGKGSVNALAKQIGSIAVSPIDEPAAAPVSTGIDVLRDSNFQLLTGKRVGLITNQTGIDQHATSTVQLLHNAPNVDLVALFSPEHGILGKLDVPTIHDSRDDATDLPVHSLYGTHRKPTPEMLAGIDMLVFDIQDIGTRFYTYISTMGLAMEAAAEQQISFVVLDRPNPIGGVRVEGPVSDPGRESFINYHRLPVRHGMTIGELARLFQHERQLKLELHVVSCRGWNPSNDFDATGLRWVNPSPNMRCPNQAFLYPGIGLLEMTNLSVGRGTDRPFEQLGAPWIDKTRLCGQLNERKLPGIRFDEVEFVPNGSKYQGQPCQGVRMTIIERSQLQSVRTGLEIARQLHRAYPEQWKTDACDRLLVSHQVCEAVLDLASDPKIPAMVESDVTEFLKRCEPFLLYER